MYLELSDIAEYSYELMHECFGKAAVEQVEEDKGVIRRSDEICPQQPRVRELSSLKFLGELFISKITNMISIPEVCSLPHLRILKIEDCHALISLPEEMKTKNSFLVSVVIRRCHSLKYIVNGHLFPSLKIMEIHGCKKLERLWDDRGGESFSSSNTNSSQHEFLKVVGCHALTNLSSIIQFPSSLKDLYFEYCKELTKLNQSGKLPASLVTLQLVNCPNLRTIAWDVLLQRPNGLHNLSYLRELTISGSMENFSMEGLATNTPLRKLWIHNCRELKALPKGLGRIDSLEEVELTWCLSILPFNLEEDFPINIKSLCLWGDCKNVYRSLVDWGLQNLNSLTSLRLLHMADMESFPHEELEVQLPSSLTRLEILFCKNLKKLKSLRQATSLQSLSLTHCYEFESFEDESLPSSLQTLDIERCPKLEIECRRNGGREWPKISNIPRVHINYIPIFLIEEDREVRSNSHYRQSCLTNPFHCYKRNEDSPS